MLPTLQGLYPKNWDVPSAIDWPGMLKVLQDVKRTGSIPLDHIGPDDCYDVGDIPIDENRAVEWKSRFGDLKQRCLVAANVEVIWVLVEGFMLYWNQVCDSHNKFSYWVLFGTVPFQQVTCQLDIRIFLRLPEHTLKERREARNGRLLAGTQHCTNYDNLLMSSWNSSISFG
jgi:nicotinamide/nicotinate riboside kinase